MAGLEDAQPVVWGAAESLGRRAFAGHDETRVEVLAENEGRFAGHGTSRLAHGQQDDSPAGGKTPSAHEEMSTLGPQAPPHGAPRIGGLEGFGQDGGRG
jgi:hypothetical protein